MVDANWHLDKTINLAHLLTTAVVVTGMFAWASNVSEEIAVIKATIQSQYEQTKLADELLNERISAQAGRSDAEMRALEGRFDRLEAMLIRIENRMDAKDNR